MLAVVVQIEKEIKETALRHFPLLAELAEKAASLQPGQAPLLLLRDAAGAERHPGTEGGGKAAAVAAAAAPWHDPALPPGARALLLIAAMNASERLVLLQGAKGPVD